VIRADRARYILPRLATNDIIFTALWATLHHLVIFQVVRGSPGRVLCADVDGVGARRDSRAHPRPERPARPAMFSPLLPRPRLLRCWPPG
jgi:hypothetical protein